MRRGMCSADPLDPKDACDWRYWVSLNVNTQENSTGNFLNFLFLIFHSLIELSKENFCIFEPRPHF